MFFWCSVFFVLCWPVLGCVAMWCPYTFCAFSYFCTVIHCVFFALFCFLLFVLRCVFCSFDLCRLFFVMFCAAFCVVGMLCVCLLHFICFLFYDELMLCSLWCPVLWFLSGFCVVWCDSMVELCFLFCSVPVQCSIFWSVCFCVVVVICCSVMCCNVLYWYSWCSVSYACCVVIYCDLLCCSVLRDRICLFCLGCFLSLCVPISYRTHPHS